MSINLLHLAVILLGLVINWGLVIAVGIFPFVTRRNLGRTRASFWIASLGGGFMALVYTAIVLSLRNQSDIESLIRFEPLFVLITFIMVAVGLLQGLWRDLNAKWAAQWLESLTNSKSNDEEMHKPTK